MNGGFQFYGVGRGLAVEAVQSVGQLQVAAAWLSALRCMATNWLACSWLWWSARHWPGEFTQPGVGRL
jgi:hypothetical protein